MDLEELGKKPVTPDNPVGEDVRYDPEFEELENEIAKLSSPVAIDEIDWEKIVRISQGILDQKSKNILVANYLCFALLRTTGLEGLAQGIHVIRDLIETFWEDMFPPIKRMRARRNAFAWWSDKIEAGLAGLETVSWPKAKRDILVEDLNSIDSFLGENIEEAPILRRLNESITGLIAEEPEPEPEVPAAEGEAAPTAAETPAAGAPAAEAAPGAPKAPAPPSEPAGEEDADKLLKQGLEFLAKVAGVYMKTNKSSPISYKLNRIVSWITVNSLPPSDGAKTMIAPPDEQVIGILDGLYQSSNWADLLEAAESRVNTFLFWLDLNRYSAESLEGLGHAQAAEAVATETANYAGRLTGIEKLTFADGTPFAGEETREWLRSFSQTEGGGSSGGGGQTEREVEQYLSEAQKMVKENKLAQALGDFRGKLNHASSLRERLIWETAFCRLLLRSKKAQLVIPYIKEILQTLDNYKLEQWEPLLALEALTVVLSSLRLQDEKSRDEALIEATLNRVSALDPVKALELL